MVNCPVDGIADCPADQEAAGCFEQGAADFALAPVIEDCCYKITATIAKYFPNPWNELKAAPLFS